MSPGTYLGITFAFVVIAAVAWLIWRADRKERAREAALSEEEAYELRQRWASRSTALDIPLEGPMRGPWERAVDRFDWAFAAALCAVCVFHLLPAMLRG